ncbi:dipeptidase PepV [Robertmurraya sp. DFI.2.37]|uniref:dipeptidase PepV n=1 Tax=Robertmurraya sp. DFI.2.37 TaxID=3031819 RepID=UPI00124667F9|nr:dipeptidase PepV [Robertmurraya sp. DFI.2.37]MDF1507031.1 dipeptidase PepV [Robertmurraya sp. DFI.2.37]
MNWNKEVEENKELLLNDLSKLLSIKSIKDISSKSDAAPMGENIKKALDFMLRTAEKDGFRTKNIDGYVGYAEIGPENALHYIAVLCHLDVVPATGNWTSDPFLPSVREGRLFARGAIDDKGPTMAAYYALKIIKDSQLALKHRVRIIFGTDEESGMSCMKKYVKVEPPALTGFAPDAEFPLIHAEKGQINVILRLKAAAQPIGKYQLCSFYSGEKGNMVPDHAEAIIEGEHLRQVADAFSLYCRLEKIESTIEQTEQILQLIVKGKSAHGMEPDKGINAATKLAVFLARFLPEQPFIRFVSERLADDPLGEKLGIAFCDRITGTLTVNAGIFRYKAMNEATLSLNIRCPVETPYLRTIEGITEAIKEYGLEIEEVREKKPHYVSEDEPVIKILQEAYEQETGEQAKLLTTGGATYARFIDNGVAYGAVFPGKENTAHQIDEYIEINDLFKATTIYAKAIYQLANI